jgi:uncharacterized protein (TIGR02246 family)
MRSSVALTLGSAYAWRTDRGGTLMRTPPNRVLAIGWLVLGLAGSAFAAPTDQEAIRQVETAQEVAWNAHDGHAYAQLFTEDADCVNVLGWHWRGRAEIERKLTQAFAYIFATSRLHIDDVSVRPLSSDIAIASVTWSMTGARSPDGSGSNIPQKGIQMQVLAKVSDRWRIVSFQNTNKVPERPFPTDGSTGQAKRAQPQRCLLADRRGSCLIQH